MNERTNIVSLLSMIKPASKTIKKDKASKSRKPVQLQQRLKEMSQLFDDSYEHPIFFDVNQMPTTLEIVEAPTHEHSERGCCSPKSHSGSSVHEHVEKPQQLIKTTKKI